MRDSRRKIMLGRGLARDILCRVVERKLAYKGTGPVAEQTACDKL